MAVWKDIILWKYERASWQWDVLCLLIIAFIFGTPKTWFDGKERLATRTTHVVVKASDVASKREHLEERVRQEIGDPNAEIAQVKERREADGELVYDVEIR